MNSNEIQDQLLALVIRHDWSYMMSDSHSVYMSGIEEDKSIRELIHSLCTICREDAERLKAIVKGVAGEDYLDYDANGYGLKYRVINEWFKPYIEE